MVGLQRQGTFHVTQGRNVVVQKIVHRSALVPSFRVTWVQFDNVIEKGERGIIFLFLNGDRHTAHEKLNCRAFGRQKLTQDGLFNGLCRLSVRCDSKIAQKRFKRVLRGDRRQILGSHLSLGRCHSKRAEQNNGCDNHLGKSGFQTFKLHAL